MGNLPTARTETCIAGAAISHNLMNEIQDVLISRNTLSRAFYPVIVLTSAPGIIVGAANPSGGNMPGTYKFVSPGTAYFGVPFNAGETISGFSYNAYGDGVMDIDGLVLYSPNMTTAPTVLATWTDSNRAAAWGTPSIGAFTSQATSAGGVIWVSMAASGGGSAYYIGPFSASFTVA